jgi:hypothetical protein
MRSSTCSPPWSVRLPATVRTGCAGRGGDAGSKPALVPATTDGKPPGNHEDHDHRLEYSYPLSAIVDGQGLSITAVSYRDTLLFGVVGWHELVPNVDRLRAYLKQELRGVGPRRRPGRGA